MQPARIAQQARLFHSSGASLANEVTRQSTFHLKPGSRQAVSGVVATVFGCTGFLGKQVVNRLGRIGSQVVIPFRGDGTTSRSLKLAGDLGAIVPVPLNVRDRDSIRRAVAQSNVVINLIGCDFETENFSYDQTNVSIAAAISEASKEAGVERLIHFSAAGASLDAPSNYFRSKAKGEIVVRQIFPEATIVRPTAVFGPGDHFLSTMAKIITNAPFVPLVNEGRQLVQPVEISDVGSAVLQILTSAASVGANYELSGPEVFSRKELFDLIAAEINREYQAVSVLDLPARLFTRVMDLIPSKFRIISSDQLKQMSTDLIVDPETHAKTFADLGITPTPLTNVLAPLLAGYKLPKEGMMTVS